MHKLLFNLSVLFLQVDNHLRTILFWLKGVLAKFGCAAVWEVLKQLGVLLPQVWVSFELCDPQTLVMRMSEEIRVFSAGRAWRPREVFQISANGQCCHCYPPHDFQKRHARAKMLCSSDKKNKTSQIKAKNELRLMRMVHLNTGAGISTRTARDTSRHFTTLDRSPDGALV